MIQIPASIEQYLSSLSALGSSPNTVRAYRTDLGGFLQWTTTQVLKTMTAPTTWSEMETLAACYLTEHRTTWAPRTTQRRLAALRGWGTFHQNPAFLSAYRPPSPARAEPHPIPEGPDGVHKMVMSTRNPRHRALIALMGMCGLRVEEAVSVRPADFYGPDSDVWLRVRGKGSKERNVPVSSEAWSHLAKAVLLAAQAGTTVTRLSNSGARKAITRHAVNAGLSRHVASHDMRATFGTAAFRRSKNLRVVQELLGHASSSTTEVYTGVSAQEMREATGAA